MKILEVSVYGQTMSINVCITIVCIPIRALNNATPFSGPPADCTHGVEPTCSIPSANYFGVAQFDNSEVT